MTDRRFFRLTGSPSFAFRALVIGIMLSTAAGVTYAVTNRPSFLASFPGAEAPAVYGGFLVVAGVGVVALAGLLAWHRWALVLYGILAAASLVLDRFARAPFAHELAVVLGATALFALAYLNRHRFRAP